MRSTPPIPQSIREYRHGDYRNIFELIPDETRLFGTESLFGDWDGEVLLLAKDFAPSTLVQQRIRENDPRPFRHSGKLGEPGFRTNARLARFVSSTGQRFLYGSAMGGLLRNDNQLSGTLPAWSETRSYRKAVLTFTIQSMPNLRAIVCLGADAHRAIAEHGAPDRIRIFKAPHPSRGSNSAHDLVWSTIRESWIATSIAAVA